MNHFSGPKVISVDTLILSTVALTDIGQFLIAVNAGDSFIPSSQLTLNSSPSGTIKVSWSMVTLPKSATEMPFWTPGVAVKSVVVAYVFLF